MKKKKLEAKFAKTKKKLVKTRTQLDEMLNILEKSGMPKAAAKPAAKKKAPTTAAKAKAKAKPAAAKKRAVSANTAKAEAKLARRKASK